jgi:predicted RNase H-like nuclease (RuvC/YqgF family)
MISMAKRQTTETTAPFSADPARASTEPLSAAARSGPDFESPDGEESVLDKVRELLFGEQAREGAERLRELEERLFHETRRLQREVSERIENQGRDLSAKLDQLARELAMMEGALEENNEKAIARIEQAAGALEEAKMGREDLAALLSEMASRVSGK